MPGRARLRARVAPGTTRALGPRREVLARARDQPLTRSSQVVEVPDHACEALTACPTAVQVARYGPPSVPERSVERSGWAAVTVVDRRGDEPRAGRYSDELVRLARRVLPDRFVCVLNRTGRARLCACAACGNVARCEACGRAVESTGELLHCRRGGADRPIVCAAWGSAKMKGLRQGVSRLREELEALLGVPVGTVMSRLHRARTRIRQRLVAAGLAPKRSMR